MLRLNIRYERRYGSSAFSDFDQARIMKPASTMDVIAIATLSPVQNLPH
jgi:hypothetical protein